MNLRIELTEENELVSLLSALGNAQTADVVMNCKRQADGSWSLVFNPKATHELLALHGQKIEDRHAPDSAFVRHLVDGQQEWLGRFFIPVTACNYQEYFQKALRVLLASNFLQVGAGTQTAAELRKAQALLSDMGFTADEAHRYAPKLVLLRCFFEDKNGILAIKNIELLDRYIEQNRYKLSQEDLDEIFSFAHESAFCDRGISGIVGIELLPEDRQLILNQLLMYVERITWKEPVTVDMMTEFVRSMLGCGILLCNDGKMHSKVMWGLLNEGRGDRTVIVMQYLMGYFIRKGMIDTPVHQLCLDVFPEKMKKRVKFNANAVNRGKRGVDLPKPFTDCEPFFERILISLGL